jgi:hypothetical protein
MLVFGTGQYEVHICITFGRFGPILLKTVSYGTKLHAQVISCSSADYGIFRLQRVSKYTSMVDKLTVYTKLEGWSINYDLALRTPDVYITASPLHVGKSTLDSLAILMRPGSRVPLPHLALPREKSAVAK